MFVNPLLNLILYEFLSFKLSCVVLFHCWPKEYLQQFVQLSLRHELFTQYVNLNHTRTLRDVPYHYLRDRRSQIGVFLDMNCPGTQKVLEQVSESEYFNLHFRWLIHDGYSNASYIYDSFKTLNISVSTQMTWAMRRDQQGSNSSTYLMFDAYNNGHILGGSLNITPNFELACNRGECTRTRYLSDLHKRSLYGNRETLRDITIPISVVVTRYDLSTPVDELNDFLKSSYDFHIDPLVRLGFRINEMLLESVDAKYKYIYYDHWTNMDFTGGGVGALVNRSVELCASPFFFTKGRSAFVTPVAATGDFRAVCMFRTPRNSGINGEVFLEPFDMNVWIAFAIILVLLAVVLWMAFFVEYSGTDRLPSFLTACVISFGQACAQGSYIEPISVGGRMVFVSLLILCFIMYNYYTSLVVSSLLGSPVKSKIKTLGQLADSELSVGLEPLPYTYTYLNFTTLPDVKRFVKQKINNTKNNENPWIPAYEGVVKMRKPGFAFIFETSTGYNLIENLYEPHEICDLNEVLFRPDSKLFYHLHRNSSYREIFRLKIVRVLESGVHNKHRRLWVRNSLNCLDTNLFVNVGMEYAAPLFLLLFCGYILVVGLLFLEILWNKRQSVKGRVRMMD